MKQQKYKQIKNRRKHNLNELSSVLRRKSVKTQTEHEYNK